jgi:hypothetical protein
MSKTTTLSPEKIELFRQILIHQAALDPRATGQVNLACPIHGDLTSDSFSANLDEATWTCHGKCDTYGGLKELQAKLLEAIRSTEPDQCFDYVDETGSLLYQIYRWDDFPMPGKKQFMTRRPGGAWGLNGARKVLYRLPEVLAADAVFVVEGEKCADRLADALVLRADGEEEIDGAGEIAVTTHPFGANKTAWLPMYSETLRGKAVAILPDHDEAGRQHAQRVATALHGVAASVRLVELPGLPEKGDIADWLDAGHSLGELMDLVAETPELTGEDLAAWEETERPVTVEVLNAPGRLGALVALAERPGVLKDPEAVKGFLELDPVDRWDFNNLLCQGPNKKDRHWVESFWKVVHLMGLNQDMPPLLTPRQMKAIASEPPKARVVERLFVQGGFTILGADPKCGKSTAIRNAIVAVLRGGEFLGRKCTPGPVIYYAMEGDRTETIQHLFQLGLDDEHLEQLGFRSGAIPRLRFLDQLRQDIEEKGAIFAVIDPLADALMIMDLNNYMEVNHAIKPLADIAAKTGCHIVALHHTNKAGVAGSAKSFLGSAQLPGATDCNIMMYRVKEDRFIKTDQRYAFDEPIPATKLVYDKDTGRVGLGEPLQPGEAASLVRREAIIETLAKVEPGEGLSQNALYDAVGGSRDDFKADLEGLKGTGQITVEKRGQAFVYRLADAPKVVTVEAPSAGVEEKNAKKGLRKPRRRA